jgi:hypothetical protein
MRNTNQRRETNHILRNEVENISKIKLFGLLSFGNATVGDIRKLSE